ncbi:DUF559 domain-containing protein [Arthrobacter sp. NicSoilB4]|uniref:DUF559 domain-containing protein n=1 Tax=Arthrobacter sp. NicSoilB4 TaxID=2830997 RepID=UPI0031FF3FCF
MQYDGGHHRTREQQSHDNRRDESFNAAGWRYFKFNSDDLADDFRGAVKRVRAALRPRKRRLPYHFWRSNQGLGTKSDRATGKRRRVSAPGRRG